MAPKISIIVPVFNVEIFLNTCIESILCQEIHDFELILVDDGSTDNSGAICDDFANIDKRIRVIHTENKGQSSARNLGISLAIGEYIGFVDSDDYISSVMYSSLYEKIIANNADISVCNFLVGDKDNSYKPFTENVNDMTLDTEAALKEIYTNRILSFSPCNKLYRRSLFDTISFNASIIYEDMDISYRLISKSERIVYIKTELYYYRYNNNSTLKKAFSLKRLDLYTVRKWMYQYYKERLPEESNNVLALLIVESLLLYRQLKAQGGYSLDNYKYLLQFDTKESIRSITTTKLLSIQRKLITIIQILIYRYLI
ncbi:MAG: glycosyltransferase [Candidatus Cloacimonetes bacterium]|nr:glycosyltransferase [Candidatus Cloacimonadota bacterium]